MSDFPSQQQDKFVLRLPDGMRDRIKAAAEDSNRSMNAEIVATLQEAYPTPTDDPMSALDFFAFVTRLTKSPDPGEQKKRLIEVNQEIEHLGFRFDIPKFGPGAGVIVVPLDENFRDSLPNLIARNIKISTEDPSG